jgi:hypothetical protein
MTRKWKTPEDIPKGSFQSMSPRFQGEAFYDNLKIVDELDRMAKEKGLETSQLALAWVVGLGPYVSLLTYVLSYLRLTFRSFPSLDHQMPSESSRIPNLPISSFQRMI